ncbi:MAG TPA: hypothetical protein VFA70_14555 [Dehalococcoidia bacterium]|nr:hypothetical protein [Dehalococcoidia bacterium]
MLAQLAGLALDSYLHARDATLAAREGVLTLSNPGHLLFALGLALAILGAGALLLDPLWRCRRPGALAASLAVLPVVGVLVLSADAFAFVARTGGLDAHEHAAPSAPVAASHDHALSTPAAAAGVAHDHSATTAAAVADASRHQHGDEVNVSWDQLREIDRLLQTAKDATEKYRDVNAARADGYLQMTQVVPGLGAHFVNPRLVGAGTVDIAHPPILLYDYAPDGGFELVGVSWTLPKKPGDDTPPDSPFGPLAVWHYHTDLCFDARSGSPVVSAKGASACRASGGLFLPQTPWMVHAWIFRDSPEGVFSHENSTITGRPPARAG